MGDQFKNIKKSTILNRLQINFEKGELNNFEEVTLKNRIQILISNNEIEEAINMLLKFYKKKEDKKNLKVVILLSSNLKNVQNQEIHGIISTEMLRVEKQKIGKGILDFIDK